MSALYKNFCFCFPIFKPLFCVENLQRHVKSSDKGGEKSFKLLKRTHFENKVIITEKKKDALNAQQRPMLKEKLII